MLAWAGDNGPDRDSHPGTGCLTQPIDTGDAVEGMSGGGAEAVKSLPLISSRMAIRAEHPVESRVRLDRTLVDKSVTSRSLTAVEVESDAGTGWPTPMSKTVRESRR
jgi:hypothetical protein